MKLKQTKAEKGLLMMQCIGRHLFANKLYHTQYEISLYSCFPMNGRHLFCFIHEMLIVKVAVVAHPNGHVWRCNLATRLKIKHHPMVQ